MNSPATLASVAPAPQIPASLLLLLALALGDFVFFVCHVIYVETGLLSGKVFSLESDDGAAEGFQYMKQLGLAVFMTALYARTRTVVYLVFAAIFSFLLLDDSLQIHEQAGAWLGRTYELPAAAALRPDDLGELLFAAAVGCAMLLAIVLAVWRASPEARVATRDVSCLILLLAFLGVIVDAVHVIAYFGGSIWAQILLIVEDGGEMLVMSVLIAYVFDALTCNGQGREALWRRLLKMRAAQPSSAPAAGAAS